MLALTSETSSFQDCHRTQNPTSSDPTPELTLEPTPEPPSDPSIPAKLGRGYPGGIDPTQNTTREMPSEASKPKYDVSSSLNVENVLPERWT